MERLVQSDKTYSFYEYIDENELERLIVEKSKFIFGEQSVYIDIKKKIGDSIITIPDGYLIDFSFANDPRLYIIENELSKHDPYKHIGSQLLKFAISYKDSGRKIKAFLLKHLISDKNLITKTEQGLIAAKFRNIDDFLESIIFEKPVAAIVIIDHATPELENVLHQLTMDTDILEFQTFISGNDRIHKFTPFNAEIRELTESNKSTLRAEELDTIVVPAKKEGFQQEFIENNCWFAIRINASMIDKIKYIAAYQVAPISAITYYAEVASITKWNDTNKYIVHFKEPAKKVGPIKLANKGGKGSAPQAPRYTSIDRLLKAKLLSAVFS